MAKKKAATKKDIAAIDRAAKRKAQKGQGAFGGRFGRRVVASKKRYWRKKPVEPEAE